MSHRISRAARALPAFVSLAFVWLTSPAAASLGGDADSVSADSVEFKGQRLRTAMPQFDRHDITTGSGTVVHEYLRVPRQFLGGAVGLFGHRYRRVGRRGDRAEQIEGALVHRLEHAAAAHE